MLISRHTGRLILTIIIASYVLLGALYAMRTPKWQTPDEPAHFNYIRHLAEQGSFPVLSVGDYPHQYLEDIKAARFPPHMSIAALNYESHQPPLYYVLGAMLYKATVGLGFDRQFLLLRLFSVVLGAAELWVIYCLVREALPTGLEAARASIDAEVLALAATALVAVLPMHIAMTAAINNDTLAELILLLMLLQAARAVEKRMDRQRALVMGLLWGLALLTKTTVYATVFGILVATTLLTTLPRQQALRYITLTVVVGLIMATPWFMRNALVYGDLDILVWKRHDMVVEGQLRTSDLLHELGPVFLLERFAVTTFRSFWAQFGWMGVVVDQRIYQALALLCLLLAAGLVQFVLRLWRGLIQLSPSLKRVLVLLLLSTGLTVLTYLGYNLKFVQHQGRYLFPALGPLAVASALSLQELLQRRMARLLGAILLSTALLSLIWGASTGRPHEWTALLVGGSGALLLFLALLPAGWRWVVLTVPYAALLLLNPLLIEAFIVPALMAAQAE